MIWRITKVIARTTFPSVFDFLRRALNYEERIERKVTRILSGRIVGFGIFRGMKYVSSSRGSKYLPKLLGTYEDELKPIIDRIIIQQPKQIIDIGAAEGYYAVGLAMKCKNASVFTYDIDDNSRKLLMELASINEVGSRLYIGGPCSPEILSRVLLKGAFIICDCEGFEETILDPSKVLALEHCSILVELHEMFVEGVAGTIKKRFVHSHNTLEIVSKEKTLMMYPHLANFGLRESDIDEGRTTYNNKPQSWLYLTPKEV
jgi:hypothetical protein